MKQFILFPEPIIGAYYKWLYYKILPRSMVCVLVWVVAMSANCKYLIFLSDVFEIWRDKTPGLRHIHWSLHISCQPSSTPGVSLKCFLFRNELIFPFLKYFIFFLICLPPPPPPRPPQLAWVVFLHHLSPRLQGGKGSGQQSNNCGLIEALTDHGTVGNGTNDYQYTYTTYNVVQLILWLRLYW